MSVVVPVRDRRPMLRELLDALGRQTFTDFEVVVVDDGSGDGSGEEAREAAARGLPVRVERSDGVGAVEARRIGVAAARGTYLAFTDSDCVPDPEWLSAGAAALDAGADIAAGVTVPVRRPRMFERTVSATNDDGLSATCNVFYRLSAYRDAGGFSDAGRRLGFRRSPMARGLGFGEDTLLAWRIRRRGRFAFVPGAIVRHAVVQPPLMEIFRRAWLAGAFAALVREAPELRRTLLRGRVWLSYRRVPVYTTAVAAALPWRVWTGGAAGLAWIGLRVRDAARTPGSWRRRIAGVPVEMAIDLITAAALLAGSVRARTPVL